MAKYNLYIHQPTPLFKARVNMSSVSYPIMELKYDGVTLGSYTDIPFDATLTLGTTEGGDDLGRVRVQKPEHTSDTIYIARTSLGVEDGTLDVQDDAYITVWDDFRVWAKIPYFDMEDLDAGNDYKDGDIPVGDNLTNIPPVANAGPPWAGVIDPDTELITVTFPQDGIQNSFAMAEGASIVSYSWDVKDGTITVGTASDPVITATFPAGFRYVALTVTDSNGKMHTTRTPVLAIDPAPANDKRIKHWKGSQRLTITGISLDLEIFDELPRENYPDGSLVLLWWDNNHSPEDRTHIKFYGWLDNEDSSVGRKKTGLVKSTQLHCVDVAGRLDKLPGFPQALSRTEEESPWSYMPNLDMSKSLHYLLFWHSTAINLVDFILPVDGGDYEAMRLDASGATLLQQVASQSAKMVPDHFLTCNSRGQMNFLRDWRLDDVSDRPAVYHTITEDNWNNLQVSYNRHPKVHVLRSGAILSSTDWVDDGAGNDTLPLVFSIAPGGAGAFGQGTSEQTENEGLALSQEDLNKAEGHRYAMLNARYGPFSFEDPTGNLFWNYEPGLLRRIQLNIGADKAAQRGLDFTEAAGMVKEITLQYEASKQGTVVNVSATWEKETSGYPALTYIPETGEVVPLNINAPVITLIGDNPLEWIYGTAFTDPGATAYDAEDGDLTDSIVVGGDTVDVMNHGDYVITYDVVDSGGKAAVQKTRIVSVVYTGVWDIDGIVAAYEPVNASTLSQSYINLANPGTYDASPAGTAPTLSGGWSFDGTPGNHLLTGIIQSDALWSMVVRFHSSSGDERAAVGKVEYYTPSFPPGASPIEVGLSLIPRILSGDDMTHAFNAGNVSNYTPALSAGVMAVTGGKGATPMVAAYGYVDGVSQEIGTLWHDGFVEPGLQPLFIGAENNNGTARYPFVGVITHLYVYNRVLTPEEVSTITTAISS